MDETTSPELSDRTLRGVRVPDPATGRDGSADLFCAGGRIAAAPAPEPAEGGAA